MVKRAKPRRSGKKPSRGCLRPSPRRSARLSKGALWLHHDVKKSALSILIRKKRVRRAKNPNGRLGLAARVAICRARPSGRRESDMTPEERQMLGGLFQRVNSAAATQRDPEAESFINDAVRTAPHAPYVLAQTVLVQQQALEAAANHISQLEAAAQQGAEQNQEHGSFLGNLGKSIFGGGPSSPPPRPDSDPQAYQRAAPSAPAGLRAASASRRLSPAAPARLPAATWPLGPAPAFGRRRRLSAECSLDRDGRGRRRRAWQSPGRPVRRP